jgi:hypothetical protein
MKELLTGKKNHGKGVNGKRITAIGIAVREVLNPVAETVFIGKIGIARLFPVWLIVLIYSLGVD